MANKQNQRGYSSSDVAMHSGSLHFLSEVSSPWMTVFAVNRPGSGYGRRLVLPITRSGAVDLYLLSRRRLVVMTAEHNSSCAPGHTPGKRAARLLTPTSSSDPTRGHSQTKTRLHWVLRQWRAGAGPQAGEMRRPLPSEAPR